MLNYKQVRQYQLDHIKEQPSPARGSQILVLGFALIIVIGTILLTLPLATSPESNFTWLAAFFTATSATTVTGLVVSTTEPTFSLFGEIVILFLIQVGGIGFITLSVVLYRLIGRRVTVYERILLSQTLGVGASAGIVQLTLMVVLITIAIELIGALIIFSQWVQLMDWQTAAYYSIFHAISAFCNAGFDLFQGLDDPLLLASRQNPVVVITLSLLVLIGTLGITVIYDLIFWPRERYLSFHTRLVLPLTLLMVLVGTLLMAIDESMAQDHTLASLPAGERWLTVFFTVVSSRTAGVTLTSLADLTPASQLIILVWMFIGGSPASMAGGVGLSTVAVVLITLTSTVRGYPDVRVLKRTIPTETISKAVAILTVSTVLVVGVTGMLLFLHEGDVFPIAFEVISAFSNTGYSLGITDRFSEIGRLLLIFTMFWGRLGPLTLVVALAQRERQTLVNYPEEKIIIG